jgi:D-glycerate 3-kinase
LADAAIGALEQAAPTARTALPRFDKASDDRAPASDWPVFVGRPEAIVIDGWCMGARELDEAQFARPINALEAEEDPGGTWRGFTMSLLANDYADFFAAFDALIYLKAPSWEIVRTWRGEQEEKLLGRALTAGENAALDRFVMHYERITRAMLAGGHSASWIVHLDEARNVVRIEQRS